MKSCKFSLSMFLTISMFCSLVVAQQGASTQSSAPVPRLVNFTGKAADAQGKPIAGIAGVTFAIYKDQYEGAPLWLEPQNIQADAKGNYTAQLGSTKPDGLPLDLFSSGDARWLGVTINGGQEQPRVLLLSVPYALKAADAETLGGRPVSAFMMAPPSGSERRQQGSLAEQANEIICLSSTACKTGFVPLFSSNGGSAKVSNSIISQSGTTIRMAGSENVNGNINSGGNLSASGNVSANGNVGASTMTAGASSNTIVATMSGNTPQTSAVTGVATATGTGNTYGVAGYSSTGNGVGVFGQASSNIGLYGTGAVGVFGTGSSFGFQTDSNVSQARTGGGWVKGMVLVNGITGTVIERCFNSTLTGPAATTPPCGFVLTQSLSGRFYVDFGFEVDDRFFSATLYSWLGGSAPAIGATPLGAANPNAVAVFTWNGSDGVPFDFYLVVF